MKPLHGRFVKKQTDFVWQSFRENVVESNRPGAETADGQAGKPSKRRRNQARWKGKPSPTTRSAWAVLGESAIYWAAWTFYHESLQNEVHFSREVLPCLHKP